MTRFFGSLDNRFAEDINHNGCKVEIGMGVTELCYSDRHAYEVVAIKDDRHITIRRLKAKRIDHNGLSECQDYEYTSNPDGATRNLFLTKKGQWRDRYREHALIGFDEKGYPIWSEEPTSGWKLGCTCYYVGEAEEYRDPTF